MKKATPGRKKTLSACTSLLKWAVVIWFSATGSLGWAQERYVVEGILDAEFYNTDSISPLLSKNEGHVGILGRLTLWSAFQISEGLQVYALAEIETDNFTGSSETNAEIEQGALRYTSQSAPYFFLEAGKILSPLVTYSNRNLSTLNPLIGEPYVYVASYPWGIQVAGASGWLDYRAALLDSPEINLDYALFDPESALRPAVGLGVTPFTGLRFGLTYTKGPYLERELYSHFPPGMTWRDFDQKILGFDFQFSRGYLELNGRWVASSYDVPYYERSTDDTAYYLELKYTWTPRFYGALRIEKNQAVVSGYAAYPTQLPASRRFRDLEVGVGYRFSPNTLLKLSYRVDDWRGEDSPDTHIKNGHSLALQLSHEFDVRSWFE